MSIRFAFVISHVDILQVIITLPTVLYLVLFRMALEFLCTMAEKRLRERIYRKPLPQLKDHVDNNNFMVSHW